MTARDVESALLSRCAAVARGDAAPKALDQREANVFRVASMIVWTRFPSESQLLEQVSAEYFAEHPDAKLPSEEVVRNGWVTSLPRLRDMLEPMLRRS
ncbi:hypothetical protein M7784_03000 [Desulfovibrio aminophilus]|nr:hypothetical protein [Desulfovibrio aminophilus]MCM0754212.1 hypothetical protein [Desulfovibrio aminophilus]